MTDFQNTPGHMLPTNLDNGPTSERRTDAQILASREANAELEKLTKRDASGRVVDVRGFKGDAQESYQEYLRRVEGLVDFKVLSEEAWRKETGQLTEGEQILQDLGIKPETSADKAWVGFSRAVELLKNDSTPGVGMSPVDPSLEAEELINIDQEPAMEADEFVGLQIEEADNNPCMTEEEFEAIKNMK